MTRFTIWCTFSALALQDMKAARRDLDLVNEETTDDAN